MTNQTITTHLNQILGNELVAINQYFLHSRILQDWGLQKLADYEYQESIEEMQHADKLVQRILFLKGLPNMQQLGKLHIGQSVKEILEADLLIEQKAVKDNQEAIYQCELAKDYPSRDLVSTIMQEEENHIEWLEKQLNLINLVGEQNYIQSQLGN